MFLFVVLYGTLEELPVPYSGTGGKKKTRAVSSIQLSTGRAFFHFVPLPLNSRSTARSALVLGIVAVCSFTGRDEIKCIQIHDYRVLLILRGSRCLVAYQWRTSGTPVAYQ